MTKDSSKAKILVVDADSGFCSKTAECLSKFGYDVVTAGSIDEAEPLIAEKNVEIVIKDEGIPGKELKDLLTTAQSSRGQTPIIMVSSEPKINSAVESFKYGAVDYLIKPVSDAMLLKSVYKAIDTYASSRLEKTVEVRNLVMEVAGYKVKRILGEGSVGIVYLVEGRGEDKDREFALKVLKPLSSDESVSMSTLKKRFTIEAKAAITVHHPNIVEIFDFGTCENNMPFILMQYCPGKALDKIIAEGTLSLRDKCIILKQLASALDAIHEHEICHRDIKPGNVIVQDDLRIKLTDFGIARLSNSNLTITSDIFGTPAYLAPEAFESAKVDWRADIFSYGSMAYELFTGQRAFKGENLALVATRIIKDSPEWPRKIDPKFPKILEFMLRKCLQKLPENRFDGAFEMYMILDDYLEGRQDSPYYQQMNGFFDRILHRK